MTFDALTMHAVRDELETTLQGGHVEKLVPLSPLEVGLRLRAQHRDYNLLMSAEAQSARIHLVQGTLRRLTDEITPFLLLMRKYVQEGRIVEIRQPTLERVMELSVEKRQDDGSTTTSSLIIEVMGRHSNVILVGADGKVLDAIKRVPPSLSRVRPILPHQPYQLPPPAEKLDPLSPLLAKQLDTAARQVPPTSAVWRFLQEGITGLGPLTAREATYRGCGDVSAVVSGVSSWEALADAVLQLIQPLSTHHWDPCVVVEKGAVIHFAPYVLTQFPSEMVEKVESISLAVERAHSERIQVRPAESIRAPMRASLQAKMERVRRREESLRQAMVRGEKAERLKLQGQGILASVGQISPGQTELRWEGETIQMDGSLSPSENAQRYFKEYAKARDATKEVPAMLDSARLEREYLEQVLTMVELADDDVALRAISREMAEAERGAVVGKQLGSARSKQKPGKGKPQQAAGAVRRFTAADGDVILVGGSAKGNERVTFDLGTGLDLWLHARGIPGAHVIVKLNGREPSGETLLEAARLAAAFSQARGSVKVPVDYTLQRFVKKVKGGPTGLVTYSQEKTLRVDAAEPEKKAPSRS
jgi:predicted ribosome quality control (RQC) complex YloA/Tae2 family protein